MATLKLGRGGAIPEWSPFAYAVAIFTLAFLGLGYSLFPYVVIDRITIWQAAAHTSSLTVSLWGAGIVLPFIIGYSILSYRIFRGKARESLYE
jgi:cytochrome d ubiquinol oxidase subunit II